MEVKSINMWGNERSSVIELISFRSLKQKRVTVPGIHHPTNVFLAKWCNSYTFGEAYVWLQWTTQKEMQNRNSSRNDNV